MRPMLDLFDIQKFCKKKGPIPNKIIKEILKKTSLKDF